MPVYPPLPRQATDSCCSCGLVRQRDSSRLAHDSDLLPSRLPIADWENFAARRVESVWLAETGAAPENR
eukprot:COSAG01_NODE_61594_length_288_cov_4.703704_1_plen_68_part_10